MSWKVRHQGSPRSVTVPAPADIVKGLQDGHWEATDEVMGPDETRWAAIENHPRFAEMAFDLEPPPVRPHEDETRLDMNALIDVCLVLLIFFILTTSYAALQKMLDLPGMTGEDQKGPVRITAEKVDKFMIRVKVRMDKPAGNSEEEPVAVIEVEGKPVEREALVPILARYVRDSRKTELLLDHSRAVPHGIVVAIQDAARGAGVERVHILVPEKELKR